MIDITQELFSGKVFDGDTAPSYSRVRTHDADGYSLTDVTFCAHNGTHLDAPSHFIQGGKTAELVSLSRLMGCCKVCSQENIPFDDLPARLLIRGAFSLSAVQAERIAEKCLLIGCEAQSIGDEVIHRILLGAEVAVLEGLDLSAAEEGEYELIALPMKLGGADGAPVRAVLKKPE